MSRELGKRMAEIEMQVYKLVGKPFNINSTQQLSDVLFKTLNWNRPTAARKPPADTTPRPRMCSRSCAASTRWWT